MKRNMIKVPSLYEEKLETIKKPRITRLLKSRETDKYDAESMKTK